MPLALLLDKRYKAPAGADGRRDLQAAVAGLDVGAWLNLQSDCGTGIRPAFASAQSQTTLMTRPDEPIRDIGQLQLQRP